MQKNPIGIRFSVMLKHVQMPVWLLFFAGLSGLAHGQDCPSADAPPAHSASAPRSLEGELIYHDGIRQWFELKPDHPQCGEDSIQLITTSDDVRPSLGMLRGCRVISTGPIDFSHTGYYSLNTYQDVTRIEPAAGCAQKPPFPDYSAVKPDGSIRRYRVDMRFETGREQPVDIRVSSAGKSLQPWQAYANYWVTGSFILYGHCGDGFVVEKVFGTPRAYPSHFDEPLTSVDAATVDLEAIAEDNIKNVHLAYTCVPEPPCRDRRDLSGSCFRADGDLRLYNGTPSARIHIARLQRVLGVEATNDGNNETFNAPKAVREQASFDGILRGEYEVCPLDAAVQGQMQEVCIDSAAHLQKIAPDQAK